MHQGGQGIGIKLLRAPGHVTGWNVTENSVLGLNSSCAECDGEAYEFTGVDVYHTVTGGTISGNYCANDALIASRDCFGFYYAPGNLLTANRAAAGHATQI